MSRLYQFLINPSHIVERHGGKGESHFASCGSTFILTCSFKRAVSSPNFKIVGIIDISSWAVDQCLSNNVTEANQMSVPMSVKQGRAKIMK